jgi:integrase
MRAIFEGSDDDATNVEFSVEELNRLFKAPLYTGCVDDENGYSRPGLSRPRRGRFWVPLLALFHGFRCNEACQLFTEDIKEEDGIPFVEIRKEREDGSKCEKRLKTKQSKRRVPLHPKLVALGFLGFVNERRKDRDEARLFPDLPIGNTGYYSDPFSKWFGRFVEGTLGKSCEATFHSFRHMFRTALEEAGVSISDAERLGGWELIKRSQERHYGQGPSIRRLWAEISKVEFSGLHLDHLLPVRLHLDATTPVVP